MANQEHLTILNQGVETWNLWRADNPEIQPELRGANLNLANLNLANLSDANLQGADLTGARLERANVIKANLSKANLQEANLSGAYCNMAYFAHANLSRANLQGAILIGAILYMANLEGADLRKAALSMVNFRNTNLSKADLSEADLTAAILIETNLEKAKLTGCAVYGISAWSVNLKGAAQSDLIITPSLKFGIVFPGPHAESMIAVDNLEVAQFIYLLLNNEKVRDVIDTITSKVVLILGSFKQERKAILDAIREELRKHDYLPVLFDFEKPMSRDITETVATLAHMARFVIADITDAKSIPQELMLIVPDLPSVPVQPLLLASQHEYGMFEHFRRYPWVLEPFLYSDQDSLVASLEEKVIAPAELKVGEQISR